MMYIYIMNDNKHVHQKNMKNYKFEMKEKSGKLVTHAYTTTARSKKEAAQNFMLAHGTPGVRPKFKPVITK